MRFVLLILAACLAAAAFAQPGGPMGRMADPQRQLDMLTEELDLSTEQVEAIGPILAEQREKRRALMQQAREQGPAGRQGMREHMLEIQAETDAKLAEHLTADQMEALRALRAQSRERMRRWRGRGGRDKPTET